MLLADALNVVLVEVALLSHLAPDGGTSTSADVSQDEVEMIASQSQNTHLLEMYRNKFDHFGSQHKFFWYRVKKNLGDTRHGAQHCVKLLDGTLRESM